MNVQEVRRLAQVLLQAVESLDDPPAAVLQFLLRCYETELALADDAARGTLEAALGRATAARLEVYEPGAGTADRAAASAVQGGAESAAEWLPVFAQMARLSADPRLAVLQAVLFERVRTLWEEGEPVAVRAAAVAAGLQSADSLDTLQLSLDALERLVHQAYAPGVGMRSVRDASTPPLNDVADFMDQVSTAEALLSAYVATGRIPYAMLADELMLSTRRRWSLEGDAGIGGPRVTEQETGGRHLVALCQAARVLSRLAGLSPIAEWRGSDSAAGSYRQEAAQILARVGPASERAGPGPAANYASALVEWLEGS